MRKKKLGRIRQAVTEILGETELVAVDIGARGDLPEPWLVLDGLARFIAFEADEEACAALQTVYDRRGNGDKYQVLPYALTRDGGPRTLYLTGSRGGSSLFNPDIPIIREYTNADYLDPITTTTIETRATAEVFRELQEQAIAMLKLDIQGCELEVLQALPQDLLDGVVMVELEASMQPRNPGYPTFWEVNEYMLGRGFELLDAWPDRVQRARDGARAKYLEDIFGVYVDSPSVSGRIWEVDVLYVPSLPRVLEAGSAAQVRRLAVCLCLYGFFSEALHLVASGAQGGIFSAGDAAQVTQAVIEWHRAARWRTLYSTAWFWRKFRGVLRRLDLPATTTQADYIHRYR